MSGKTPLERMQENQKLLERLILRLPGFQGYALKEQRREADKIVRNYIYRVLQQSRDNLTSSLQALSDNKATELLEPMNRLVAKMDRVAQKFNHASYGYSGYFDAIKIEQADLDRMLTYDTQLMGTAKKLTDQTAKFKNDLTQVKLENARTDQQALNEAIDSLELAFDQRKSIIEGVEV